MFASLRLRLPLLLMLFVVGAAELTLLIALPLQNRAIESRSVERAHNQIDFVQSGLNTILRQGDMAAARTFLGSLMFDTTISRILLLDSAGQVLIDPSHELDNPQAPAGLDANLRVALRRVLARHTSELDLLEDGSAVHGFYPVTLQAEASSSQTARSAVLFIEYDVLREKAAERRFMLLVLGTLVAVTSALTVLLGLILDRAINGPVQQLLHTAQAVARGDRDARAQVSGSSEFVMLATALNTMTIALDEQQKDLRERELQLRLSSKFSGTGTFEWNLKDNLIRGTRHFWMTFFGEHLNGPLPYAVAVHSVLPADRSLVEEALRTCAIVGSALDVHFRCRDRDGLLHWLHLLGNAERDDDGCARRIVALTRDETEEIAARDTLRNTARELEYQKYALDQHSIVAITDVNGIITYVNDKFCAVSGYSREELIGHSHALLKSDAHDARFYQDMWRTIAGGEVWRGEFENRRKDGVRYWVDTTIVPHQDADDRTDGYISIRTDISARVKGERERQHLLQQLYQTQKVEALGLLSGGIAHDFNNLLAVVLGHAELARRRFAPRGEERLGVYLHEISCAAERGRDLVQRLLTFSHGSSEQTAALDVADEISNSLRMLRPLLPTSITITSDLHDDAPPVAMAVSQMQQIVMNLCINARDAIGDTGTLHVALRFQRRHGRCAACGVNFDGKFVTLTVEDSGQGISEAILDRIFDPFFTTKAVGEGTGLGLSVVHGIVHQTGGHITVSAGASGGTCVEILLAPCTDHGRHDPLFAAAPLRPKRPALEHST